MRKDFSIEVSTTTFLVCIDYKLNWNMKLSSVIALVRKAMNFLNTHVKLSQYFSGMY